MLSMILWELQEWEMYVPRLYDIRVVHTDTTLKQHNKRAVFCFVSGLFGNMTRERQLPPSDAPIDVVSGKGHEVTKLWRPC